MGVTLSLKSLNNWGSIDTPIEVGTPIRITHRISVRSIDLIPLYYCGIQFDSYLNIKPSERTQDKIVYKWCCYHPYIEFTKTYI